MDFHSDFTIKTKNDLRSVVEELGFMPFFSNQIPGFSVEDHIDPDVWFSGEDGPWEWKGPVIRESGCAYGKFFEKKAVFVSRDWFPDFANYRRNGYDFDARFEDGLAAYRDKDLYELLDSNAPILSKVLKKIGNYKKGGKKGFDTIITRLQEQCYILVSDFVYETDKYGNEYGWGVAEYSTPERFLGQNFCDRVYKRSPEESYERILKHMKTILPMTEESVIRKILK